MPLLYLREGPSLAVIASFGGKPRHPDWYWNLRKDPNVGVQVEGERFPAKAREADAEERARVWPRAVAARTGFRLAMRRARASSASFAVCRFGVAGAVVFGPPSC